MFITKPESPNCKNREVQHLKQNKKFGFIFNFIHIKIQEVQLPNFVQYIIIQYKKGKVNTYGSSITKLHEKNTKFQLTNCLCSGT